MSENELSFLFIIPIESGFGSWPFPKQLRENLYQNSVRVRGLYSKDKAYQDEFLFVLSNVSQHSSRHSKSVITNVLAIFSFSKPKLFQWNGASVTAPINIIPSDIKLEISNDSFERVKTFNGWAYIEILGIKKNNIE